MDANFISNLCQFYPISEDVAKRMFNEFLEYFHETQEDFIKRRHHELQKEGHNNNHIFEALQREMVQHRFKGSTLSIRQIRRIIYG